MPRLSALATHSLGAVQASLCLRFLITSLLSSMAQGSHSGEILPVQTVAVSNDNLLTTCRLNKAARVHSDDIQRPMNIVYNFNIVVTKLAPAVLQRSELSRHCCPYPLVGERGANKTP